MSCTRGAHRGPTGSSTTSAPCWQGSILQQRMLTLLRSCCIPLQVSLLLWSCPAMALLCRAFMALPCHDAALRCPALPCPALPCPAVSWLCTHRSSSGKVWYLHCICACSWASMVQQRVLCRSCCCHPPAPCHDVSSLIHPPI